MAISEPLEGEAAKEKSSREVESISSWEETDTTGQRWEVRSDGSKLKRGNLVNVEKGRPKKEVREDTLKAVSAAALPWAMRVMANPDIPDESPAKARAAEILFRFGLGTQDEFTLASEEVPRALGEVLGRHASEIPQDLARTIVTEVMQALNVKGF